MPRQLLDSPRLVPVACAASLVLGLFFMLVWAPHPWGWTGIDQYHDLARSLARGRGFPTTDVPWGYAGYAAAFYWLFGERPWVPVLGQVLANACVPALLYSLVRPLAGQRTAALSALIAGVFSFNTIYASTQASDAICTVLFLVGALWFARGHRSASLGAFAVSGLIAGVAPQFRPNLLLLPAFFGGLYWLRRPRARLAPVAVFLAASALALTPWVVRNYALAGVLLPTSSHGAVQLWYGSLQVGPYLEDRSINPRAVFERPPFDYTSLAGQSILVSGEVAACATAEDRAALALTYWTDRDGTPRPLTPRPDDAGRIAFEIPGQPDPTAVYWRVGPDAGTPPFVYFVSSDHLGDLDRHDDLWDIYDLIRLVRHVAWQEPLPHPGLEDLTADGRVTRDDVPPAVARLLYPGVPVTDVPPLRSFEASAAAAVIEWSDGSRVTFPRQTRGRVSDLGVEGALGAKLLEARVARDGTPLGAARAGGCALLDQVRINDVFYRRELQQMGRYAALALDNITREPAAFAAASAYRAVRLFVVRPGGGRSTTYQYAWASVAYTAALALSLAYFLMFLAGAWLAWRRRSPLLPLLIPIIYIPLTISMVLTNQRYTVTVQPLMFAFIAYAIVTVCGWDADSGGDGHPTAGRN